MAGVLPARYAARAMRRRTALPLLAFGLLSLVSPAAQAARTQVRWTKVEVRAGDDAKRVARTLKRLLRKATRRAKWGRGKGRIALSAKVTRLKWVEDDEVLRVSVTVVARIAGGKRARSKIRIGGRPKRRRALEKEALKIVADGLVTRLSNITRGR